MKRTFVAWTISEIPELSHGIQDRRPRHSKHPSLLAMPAVFSVLSIILVGRFPELTPVRSQTTSRGFLPWMPVTAAFHSLPFLIRTLLYPQRTSNLVKSFFILTRLISCGIRGSGYRLRIVHSFKRR